MSEEHEAKAAARPLRAQATSTGRRVAVTAPSQWLGKGAEVEPTQTTRTIGYGRTSENELTEAPTIVVKRQAQY